LTRALSQSRLAAIPEADRQREYAGRRSIRAAPYDAFAEAFGDSTRWCAHAFDLNRAADGHQTKEKLNQDLAQEKAMLWGQGD